MNFIANDKTTVGKRFLVVFQGVLQVRMEEGYLSFLKLIYILEILVMIYFKVGVKIFKRNGQFLRISSENITLLFIKRWKE